MSPLTIVMICAMIPATLARGYGRRDNGQSVIICRRSSDCPLGQCCRDQNGNLIGASDDLGFLANTIGQVGQCSSTQGRPGEVCTSACGCTAGHECYRTVTGVCCPPKTCWTKAAAKADKKYWDNCRPPTCFFPPVAPPSNGPQL